jgi:hypothetical protein
MGRGAKAMKNFFEDLEDDMVRIGLFIAEGVKPPARAWVAFLFLSLLVLLFLASLAHPPF